MYISVRVSLPEGNLFKETRVEISTLRRGRAGRPPHGWKIWGYWGVNLGEFTTWRVIQRQLLADPGELSPRPWPSI